jgi:hypothetical protein
MRRRDVFELHWSEIVASQGDALPERLPGTVARELETAWMLSILSGSLRVPPDELVWTMLNKKISTGGVAPVTQLNKKRIEVNKKRHYHPVRAALAVAAVLVVLVAVSLHAGPESPLYGLRRGTERAALALAPNDTGLHARLASARLSDLLVSLRQADYSKAPALAAALAQERDAAVAGGADVRSLDAQITSSIPSALAGAPKTVADQVTASLVKVLPGDTHDDTTTGYRDGYAHGNSPGGWLPGSNGGTHHSGGTQPTPPPTTGGTGPVDNDGDAPDASPGPKD